MLRKRRETPLLLCIWLLLPPSFNGSGSEQIGPRCINCGNVVGADCIVNSTNQTITCGIDTTPCNYIQCDDTQGCLLAFTIYGGSWTFHSACQTITQGDKCHLVKFNGNDDTFPPPDGIQCVCNNENCFSDGPLVYVHPPETPEPVEVPTQDMPSFSLVSSVPSLSFMPSFSLMPSSSPPSNSDTTSSFRGSAVIAVVVVAVIVLVAILAVIVVFVLVTWRLRTKRQRTPPNSRGSSDSCFQNLSGEQDLPFQLVHLISRGRFGYVYRTQYENELVAVKIFSYQNQLSWENEKNLFAMDSTKHRNVVNYVVSGSWGSGYQLQMFIVTPFYPLGSLNRFLARNTVSWEQACRVIHSVSNGLSHLHSESYTNLSGVIVEKYAVAHRDVKSANVLVRGENGDCVIADLGFAMILDPARDEKDMANTGQVGTYRYMAPEVLDARVNLHNMQAFKQIDIYALALVMWEVVWRCNVQEAENPRRYMMAYEDAVGQRPGIDDIREIVCTQKLRPQILSSWRYHPGLSSLVDTMEECWDQDPEARLSAINIVLRLKELLDGGPTALTSDHTPSHIFTHMPVVSGAERFRRSDAQESTAGTTDSRPPPYDIRWGYAANSEDDNGSNERSAPSSMELNFDETTV